MSARQHRPRTRRRPRRVRPLRAAALRGEEGQATVELALLLPVVVVVLLVVVQAGLLVRDRLAAVHAVRVAARSVIVDPSESSAVRALDATGGRAASATVQVGGDTRPGGMATVQVQLSPTPVPLVGRVVAGAVIEERLTVLVEGTP